MHFSDLFERANETCLNKILWDAALYCSEIYRPCEPRDEL